MALSKYAIIVAGGKGSRMQSSLPKQFLPLNGKPILVHTIEQFHLCNKEINIIVVLPKADVATWEEIQKNYLKGISVKTIIGGETRFHSVKNGLESITKEEESLIAIHDGVRPLVSSNIINTSYQLASTNGSAIASVSLKDSIRSITPTSTKAEDRSKFKLIQTPQTFKMSVIKKAYDIDYTDLLTDDASVAELNGHKITLFDGSYDNIKITTPEDLLVATAILNNKTKAEL